MDLRISRSYRVNRPKVIFEAFEDETVLINLDSGSYYSFSGSGTLIWDLISSGHSVPKVTAKLQKQFPDDAAQVESGVRDFIAELINENLILEQDVEASGANGQIEQPAPRKNLIRFERPFLQKYSDMQELLLLDPIHEVDETGWPSTRPPESSRKAIE
jgi:Coenzyme PQQ synthesis protein D (PqqD)